MCGDDGREPPSAKKPRNLISSTMRLWALLQNPRRKRSRRSPRRRRYRCWSGRSLNAMRRASRCIGTGTGTGSCESRSIRSCVGDIRLLARGRSNREPRR